VALGIIELRKKKVRHKKLKKLGHGFGCRLESDFPRTNKRTRSRGIGAMLGPSSNMGMLLLGC
jgi:hypothetical protein